MTKYTESCSGCQYKHTCMCDNCINREYLFFKGSMNNHSDIVYEPSLLGEPDVIIDVTKPFRYIRDKLGF